MFSLTRTRGLGALALFCTFALAPSASADDIDHPSGVSGSPLVGSSELTGTVTRTVGFPSHEYTVTKDGFARIQMETTNLPDRQSDNEGIAWRPYLRVVSISNEHRHGEAWSSNGHQRDVTTGRAVLVLRVRAGEKFTVIATLAQNVVKKRPDATANYKLVVTEVTP